MRAIIFATITLLFAAVATATVLVSGQTTTIVTANTPVQVAFEGSFPRLPHQYSNPVACGSYVCGLSTNLATHNYADIELNGQNSGSPTIDVTNAPTGSQPSISIYQTGSAVGTWNLTSGSNNNFLGQLAANMYPVNTVFSVYVNGGANTQFAFSPYVSNTNVGFLFSVQ